MKSSESVRRTRIENGVEIGYRLTRYRAPAKCSELLFQGTWGSAHFRPLCVSGPVDGYRIGTAPSRVARIDPSSNVRTDQNFPG